MNFDCDRSSLASSYKESLEDFQNKHQHSDTMYKVNQTAILLYVWHMSYVIKLEVSKGHGSLWNFVWSNRCKCPWSLYEVVI